MGGKFTSLAGQTRNNIARLTTAGIVDLTFSPNADGEVYALAAQPDGKIVVAGDFQRVDGIPYQFITRLNSNGAVDATLNLNMNSGVEAIAVQPDGKLVLGGYFNVINGQPRSRLARLNSDGTVDPTFDPHVSGSTFLYYVTGLAVQPDGKLLLGGQFDTVGGAPHRNIARVNKDGSVDHAFNPYVNYTFHTFVVQADGKIVVGGNFSHVGGHVRNNIARLHSDGTVDTTFGPSPSAGVYALAVQSDGKLLVGGQFSFIDGQPRGRIARLNSDGSVDLSFHADVSGDSVGVGVSMIALQPDGKLVVGGQFNGISGQARNSIARLNSDGTIDASFDANANRSVTAGVLLANGKLVVSGYFDMIGGQPRKQIALLNSDGSADQNFNLIQNDAIRALAVQTDGKLVLGGGFSTVNALPRKYIARLSMPHASLQSIEVNDNAFTWLRSGAGPELARAPELLYSLDGNNFTPAGTMQRSNGQWQSNSFVPPLNQPFYLRTRGWISGGTYNASSSLVESIRQFYLETFNVPSDHIFAQGFERARTD